MKVSELIALLQEHDPEGHVVIERAGPHGDGHDIRTVEVSSRVTGRNPATGEIIKFKPSVKLMIEWDD